MLKKKGLNLGLFFFGLLLFAKCFSVSSSKDEESGVVIKVTNISYIGDSEFSTTTLFAWNEWVLEEWKKLSVQNSAKVDSIGKINIFESSSEYIFKGYFLVNLKSKTYYQFNSEDSLILSSNLINKKEGIQYHKDFINQSLDAVDDLISDKDTVINGENLAKLTYNKGLDNFNNVYEILINKDEDLPCCFRPVSFELSKKYRGIITECLMFDTKSRLYFKEFWDFSKQLNDTEATIVQKYKNWSQTINY